MIIYNNDMRITPAEIKDIVALREKGHSFPEIAQITGRSKSLVWRYSRNIDVQDEYQVLLKSKRGGSHLRAQQRWESAQKRAVVLLQDSEISPYLTVLACLYWAEGNKKEFTFTNTDPLMISVAVQCLKKLNINPSDFKISVRIFEDMNPRKDSIAEFWANITDVSSSDVIKFNILEGKKLGKLQNGMCRIRIKKSAEIFKLLMSSIRLIIASTDISPHSSTDRATDS